jgi:hypothetical protein
MAALTLQNMRQLDVVARYVLCQRLHLDPAAWKRGGGALHSFEPVGSLTRGMEGGREGGMPFGRSVGRAGGWVGRRAGGRAGGMKVRKGRMEEGREQ